LLAAATQSKWPLTRIGLDADHQGSIMKAYWIGRIQITDEAGYAEYVKRGVPAIELHGGKILARGGRHVTLEGHEFPRNVVIEFSSLDQAVACYRSKEYQAAWRFQNGAAIREICIVEAVPEI